jgi:DNA polymerase-3 subunit delta'
MGFEAFVGNERVVGVLRQMLRSGRLPHALLFTGPAGIGKFTLAVMLARAVNCAEGGDNFCGRCSACRAIGQLEQPEALIAAALAERGEQPDAATVERVPLIVQAHPDVWLVPPDPVRRTSPAARPVLRMGQLRAVQGAAELAPGLRRRIFILTGADTMRWDYATVLLKTLEEAPETALFILLAPAPETLLPTLRSRCLVFRFAPVAATALEDFLAARRPDLKSDERRLVAHLAHGRPGLALRLDLPRWLALREAVVRVLERAACGALGEALAQVERLVKPDAGEFENILELFYSAATDLLRYSCGFTGGNVRYPDLQARLESLGRQVDSEWVTEVIHSLDRLASGMRRNLHRELQMAASVARWSARAQTGRNPRL